MNVRVRQVQENLFQQRCHILIREDLVDISTRGIERQVLCIV